MKSNGYATHEFYARSPGHSPGYRAPNAKDAFDWIDREKRRGAEVFVRVIAPDGEIVGEYRVVRP